MAPVALAVMAHPDDAEFLCAGTLIRLAKTHGWAIHIATMTPGDCGSAELPPDEISAIRRQEGHRAASLLGGTFHCLEERDLRVFFNENTLEKVTHLLRKVKPAIVFTHSPQDYMVDHEVTSTLARAACFAAPVPNSFMAHTPAPPLEKIPHLYYCDPIEGKDLFGQEIRPGFCIDISAVMDTKIAMLASHASQRDWLLKHHGMDQYLESMKAWGAHRGAPLGLKYAEGFRQHLGHSYPQDNLLEKLLPPQLD